MTYKKIFYRKHLLAFVLIAGVSGFTPGKLKSQSFNQSKLPNTNLENLKSSNSNKRFDIKKDSLNKAFSRDTTHFKKSFEILIGGGVSFPFYDPIKESLEEMPLNPLVNNLPDNWFWDNWDMGYIISFGAGYTFAPKLTASLLIDYSSYTLDKNEYRKSYNIYEGYPLEVGKTSVLVVSANLKGDVSKNFYFTFGIGIHNFSVPDIKVTSQYYSFNYGGGFSQYDVEETYKGDNDTGFMLGFGWGLQIPVGNVKPFMEVDYAYFLMKGENTSYFPIKAGVMYNF